MKRVLTIVLVLFVSLSLAWMAVNAASPWPGEPPRETPTPTVKTPVILAVEEAIQDQIDVERATTIFFWNRSISIEGTQVSPDGLWAASLLVPLDIEGNTSPETEPALVISQQIDGEWQVWLPNTPGWMEQIQQAPDDLLSPEHKAVYRLMNTTTAVNLPSTALDGYLLPWDAGVSYYLTGSTCHDEYIPSGNAHHAFDFAYNRTMWDILAVKNAEVWLWQDDVPTCYDWTCSGEQTVGNYLVLRDTNTNPVTYHLYLHLKQGSIPNDIKEQGHPILQGQFIAIVDNTGQSWGSHLHFQVQVPLYGEDYYWGRAVDITFDDVDVNGGRPRINNPNYCLDFNFCGRPGDVCETSQLYYTSQNVRQGVIDTTPPIGDILNPQTGETYTDLLPLEAWAEDLGNGEEPPIGLESAQFIAYYEGVWHDIGPAFSTSEFSYDWDWCAADVPEGPVSVALRLRDFLGNQTPGLPGLKHVTKQYACPPQPPPPTCQPAANQAAIFSEINYQGDCQVLDVGSYSNSAAFGSVGNDNTFSMLLGSTVQAELFTESNFGGRSEIVQMDDSNLSENPIESGTLSSLKVFTGTATARGATTPQVVNVFVKEEVKAAPTAGVTAPFSDTLENGDAGWDASGLWHLSEVQSHSATHSWRYGIEITDDYDTLTPNDGYITTPEITLTVSLTQPYVLQFWYRYETESHYPHWDQRWVQIKVDDKPFTNTYQLYDDPMGGWLKARIDLLPYYDPGDEHTLQVRFFFDTIDETNNGYEGWYIDDIQVAAEPPIPCPTDTHEPNDNPGQAKSISYGSTTNAAICPGWDFDYFKFTGTAGDRVVADVDAKSSGSDLDGYLFLLDNDGSSELAESDDEILFELQDPLLGYMLPRDGTYYLKMKAWDRPTGTGEYTLDLFTDNQNPSITLDFPLEGEYLPMGVFTFTVQASDTGSGVRYVQFMYHPSDWLTGDWVEISTDYDGSDGWHALFDTSGFTDGEIISVYARAFDWAGNWNHAAAWSVGIDAKPPTVTIEPLPDPSESTALHLHWTATDSGSGIETVNVEYKIDSADWTNLLTDTEQADYWFIGQADHEYAFRVYARDRVGYESTTLPVNSNIPPMEILCSNPDNWDLSATDNDNTPDQATEIAPGDSAQHHNFCNPADSDWLNDQDWLTFNAEQGQQYMLIVTPVGESAAVTIRLFAANGNTLLAETLAETFGEPTRIRWEAPQNGEIYVQLLHSDGRVAGNGVSYTVQLFDATVFLPLTQR